MLEVNVIKFKVFQMKVSTHFYMLTGLNEFRQKSFQFGIPLNKVGEVTLQILLSKRKNTTR